MNTRQFEKAPENKKCKKCEASKCQCTKVKVQRVSMTDKEGGNCADMDKLMRGYGRNSWTQG